MRVKKVCAAVGAACVSLVFSTSAFAQDDLDNLLNDLEGDAKKKPAEAAPAPVPEKKVEEKPAAPAPAATPTPEKKAEEKPAAPAPAPVPEKKAEEKPAATPAPEKKVEGKPAASAPAPAPEKKVEEKKPTEKPVEENVLDALTAEAEAEKKPVAKPKAESEVDALATVPAAPAPVAPAAPPAPAAAAGEAPAPAPAPVAAAGESPAPASPAPVAAAEETPAPASPAPVAAAEEPKAAALPPETAKLISEIVTAEKLRRESFSGQARLELTAAREAMQGRNWDEAYKSYKLANSHLLELDDEPLRNECRQGMAKARYEAAKQALKESNREAALRYAEEAMSLEHPHAGALIEGLKSEQTASTTTDAADIRHRRNDEGYKKDRDLIRQRLRLSSQYLAVADLGRALEQCDLVLRSDPYNQQALSLRTRIQQKRQMIMKTEREATRFGMIADVDRAWRPAYAVNSVEVKDVDGGTMKTPVGVDPERSTEQSIEKRMKAMMLPQIEFRPPATIDVAVETFRQMSIDFDRPEIPESQRGFNFLLDPAKGGEAPAATGGNGGNGADAAFGTAGGDDSSATGDKKPLQLFASNISLWEALEQVCKIAGYKFRIQGSFVKVMPLSATDDDLVTRSYNVIEDFETLMNTASSNIKDDNRPASQLGGGGDEGGSSGVADEKQWKRFFEEVGDVKWAPNSKIRYIKAIGKLKVTNTPDQLANFEVAMNELNVTPRLIEIETRFVEVAQEDLNSLGFEWLLNTDYQFNVGGKLKKALNLKDGAWNTVDSGYSLSEGTRTIMTESGSQGQYTIDGAGNYVRLPNSPTVMSQTGIDGSQFLTPSGVMGPLSSTRQSETYTWSGGSKKWTNYDPSTGDRYNRLNGRTGKNVGVSAINGTDYSSGMRYLSTDSNHISGQGNSSNDQFMRVNAFLGNADLSMILHMLSQRSDTDLLSAPKVVTKRGKPAEIKVVTIYRYPTDYNVTIQSASSSSTSYSTGVDGYRNNGGGGSKILPMVQPQNFETQEVGVILKCTPDISDDGQMINLELNPEVVSEPTWHDYGMKVPMASVVDSSFLDPLKPMEWYSVPMEQPFFKRRAIETNVSIYNGATIVMGGMITEERKSMEDKIPFLGDIQFVGRLFRSRSEWSNKRNLLLFVTARLVDPSGRQVTLDSGDDARNGGAKAEAGVTPAPAR